MDTLNKLYELMDQLGLDDVVDVDCYCDKNPDSEVARLYFSLSKEEYESFLENSDK